MGAGAGIALVGRRAWQAWARRRARELALLQPGGQVRLPRDDRERAA